MNISKQVFKKIDQYNPKGGLCYTAKFFLALCEVNHTSTKDHVERVALLAEQTAKILRKDKKAAFFAGLFHDIGKVLLPAEYFDGHEVTQEEYAKIRSHAQAEFKALRRIHLFTALCAGLHHNLYQAGYGITQDVFPERWSPVTVKKVLDISIIISICDFVDAYMNRDTKIKDGSEGDTLKEMLYKKYADELLIVDTVLSLVDYKIQIKVLGSKIFFEVNKMEYFNGLMKDPMLTLYREKLNGLEGTILVSSALFAEANIGYLTNYNVILIDAKMGVREERLRTRGYTPEEIKARIGSQLGYDVKKTILDRQIAENKYGRLVVVDNTKKSKEQIIEELEAFVL